MKERKGQVTFKGNPLTLLGEEVKVGDKAPDVALTGTDMSEVKLSEYRGKKLVISAVPSLDTPVCDVETRRFNQEADRFGADVKVLTVSMDLPFAQRRWQESAEADETVLLSDHKEASFGQAYGVLIKELRLLARTVFVVDKEGVVRYKQMVSEVADEPNYDEVLSAVQKLH